MPTFRRFDRRLQAIAQFVGGLLADRHDDGSAMQRSPAEP
jgi:hypothetical protein